MHIKTTFERQSVYILILLIITLCIGIYLIGTAVVIAKDGVVFIEYAKDLETAPAETMIQEDHHPGYPVMILATHKIASQLAEATSIFSWIYSAQSTALIFRLLAIVVLYFIGTDLVGSKFSFWAILILILLPKPAKYGSDALSDWPHMLFLTAGMLLLMRGAISSRWPLFGFAGLAGGAGYLIRPECIQVIIYGFLWLTLQLFGSKRAMSRRKTALALVLLVVGFCILAGPYVKLNGAVFGGRSLCQSQPQVISKTVFTADIIPSDIAAAFAKLMENISETLMWFFVPALLVGLYKSFRKARWYDPERFFIIVFVGLNIALMVWLFCRVGYISVRHTLPLVAFTVFYVPAGLHTLAVWLDKRFSKKSNVRFGFVVLVVIGIAICAPKLLRPLHYDKETIRKAAQWLAENTERDDVVAAADPRIGFYANRRSIYYDNQTIPQTARYVAKVFKNPNDTAADNQHQQYRKVFSFQDDSSGGRTVIIYEKSL